MCASAIESNPPLNATSTQGFCGAAASSQSIANLESAFGDKPSGMRRVPFC